ncbi:MAG: cation transporter [Lachnospiraceae bacterium]|nr:cation transporter [Lachnospiraceae bacterium]MBQ9233475.1 cation transporter [Lachnospiraceae bacterium]
MGNIQEAQNALNSEEVSKKIISRDKIIIRTSVIGILANVFLAGFKAVVGLLTHSIAIIMDAVNNLTDAASSLITIIGTKLAAKEPDKKHPFGHGRVEYLSAMVIAVLVLYAGVTSLIESIKKIITPKKPEYTVVALVIVAVAVVVKIVLGRYVKAMGEKTNSDALVNSGQDATMDSVISASTLVAAVIFQASGLSLEAWLGAIISIIIIKSGIDMLRETISQLLGERIDRELALAIKETVTSFPDVQGAYDLILNNYGPNAFNGSVHVEVPDTYTAYDLDDLLRQITIAVFEKHNVILTAIGVYSVNTKNDYAAKVRDDVSKIVFKNEYALQMHGFYLNEEKKTIRFDVVVSFDAPDRKEVYRNIVKEVNKIYPDYTLQIALDTDFSD